MRLREQMKVESLRRLEMAQKWKDMVATNTCSQHMHWMRA
jgi:hypothetical protein